MIVPNEKVKKVIQSLEGERLNIILRDEKDTIIEHFPEIQVKTVVIEDTEVIFVSTKRGETVVVPFPFELHLEKSTKTVVFDYTNDALTANLAEPELLDNILETENPKTKKSKFYNKKLTLNW